MKGLREKLEEITRTYSIDQHADIFLKIKTDYAHSIVRVSRSSDINLQLFNCYMFALGIENEKWAQESRGKLGTLQSAAIQIAFEKQNIILTQEGPIIVYIDSKNVPTHMGRLHQDGTVVSKWGAAGHIWQHEVFEVPASYGESVQYLKQKDAELLVKHFRGIYDGLDANDSICKK